jgi:hypothetical protein
MADPGYKIKHGAWIILLRVNEYRSDTVVHARLMVQLVVQLYWNVSDVDWVPKVWLDKDFMTWSGN